ncbi:hypothetical protein ACOI1H_22260 [Loktanella sp. DJP18]|uniref:hypothetical protein n=1 Tax=Loktanella sp. DJP18 TaxID=3409788 RepID=UPI003BB5158D
MSSESSESPTSKRGKGRGGKFFVIDRAVWEQLWDLKTGNRMNFVLTYLVLSAGTGSDHRLSKWSTKACERYTGLGKPRAKVAVDELISYGLIKYTERSTKSFPQYQLMEISLESDPIFLPVAFVTGLSVEASFLRRVRETGDPLLLRMLVDIYGMIQLDATYGLPIDQLSLLPPEEYPSRKLSEVGVHAIWAVRLSGTKSASGSWTRIHRITRDTEENWVDFWSRVALLEKMGAIYYEPWVFDSIASDAEPLFPVNPEFWSSDKTHDDAMELTQLISTAIEDLVRDRTYIAGNYGEDLLIPLSAHRQMPSIRGVARVRIEADTPGRRFCYQQRKSNIKIYYLGFLQLIKDVAQGDFSRPVNTSL